MRKVQKSLILTLCAIMMFMLPADHAFAENSVSFGKDQQLKILIISDTQDTENPQKAMLTLLNDSLDSAEPDLVVFLGDMIHGPSVSGIDNVRKAIDAIVTPVADRQIPFALVFGNHDEECGISNEEQLKIYQSYPGCLITDSENLPGCGNCHIVIENPAQPDKPVVLWFLDSGNHAEEGKGNYGYVHEEQNEWMLREYDQLKSRYGEPVSYVFQHIAVPQIYNFLKEVPFGTAGSVTQVGGDIFKWYLPDEEAVWAGHFGEAPCSSDYDSGEFDAWKKMNVKAAFFGHDHMNDFCVTYDGIDLVATSGAGFYHYGRGDEHGTRLITLNAENPAGYETRMLYYKDVVSEPLPGLFVPGLGVLLQRYLLIILAILVVLTVLIVWLIRHIRKTRRKKKAEAKKEEKAADGNQGGTR